MLKKHAESLNHIGSSDFDVYDVYDDHIPRKDKNRSKSELSY